MNHKEFIKLADVAKEIVNNGSIEWETKYELIFSDAVCDKILETGIKFEWIDPDTTYKEDVMAFVNAVGTKADELRGLDNNRTGTTCIDCKHFIFDWDWDDGYGIYCKKDVWSIHHRDNTDNFCQKMRTAERCELFEGVENEQTS